MPSSERSSRDWQVSGITQYRSGRPLGSITGAACNLQGAGNCYADFNPAFSGDVRINGDYGDGDVLGANPPTYIDRNAFQSAPAFTFGNTPRTLAYDLRNPSFFNQDLSVKRDFRIGRTRLGLGVDVFNVFNNVIFGGIQTNITNANFGRVSSQANTPRVGQIKVRFTYQGSRFKVQGSRFRFSGFTDATHMQRRAGWSHWLAAIVTAAGLAQQQPPAGPPPATSTRPPENNDQTLRPLTPEEIPPNLNFYAMDPLYKPGAPLGWAAERIRERLDRGLVAVADGSGRVHVSWRLLETDPRDAGFHVFRTKAGAPDLKLTAKPVVATTDFIDASPVPDSGYRVALAQRRRGSASARRCVDRRPDQRVPRHQAQRGREERRSRRHRRSERRRRVRLRRQASLRLGRSGPAGPEQGLSKIDGYDGKTGAFLWRIDLGWNINHGIWFSPMVVRDLDGDGKAEVCLRTAPYAATREQALDGGKGFVLQGPEYLSVYSGETGAEIAKVDWIERGETTDWADRTGNRSSRHMLGIAYLDGKTPSVLVVRGTYGLMKIDAWTLRDRTLRKIWRWTNERQPFKYQGQGQHSIKVGDIDGDGFDEILNGSIAIDNDGRTMWGTGLGHGDRFYLSDIDPDRPGLEIWYTIEDPHPQNGVSLWDAKLGTLLFGSTEPNRDNQIAGGLVGDIDPEHPGMEVWGDRFFFTAKGRALPGDVPRRASSCGGTAISRESCTTADRSRNGRAASSDAPRAPCSTSRISPVTGGKRSSRSPAASCAST